MNFQGSKPGIQAPESKTYILHCKMYVFFWILEWNFKVPSLKLKPQSQKHTFYTVKCMFFQFWNEILRFPSLKLKPQSQKHTCYTIKCMFLAQGLFCEKACLDHANCVKTYILHCKMYVFYNSGMIFQDSKIEIEAPESKTYILHCKMYVFSILEWNFKVPSLKLKPQSQKHTFCTVKCMFFQFWNEISRFQTWNWSPRVKNIHFTL